MNKTIMSLWLLAILLTIQSVEAKEICVEGFVMDTYCIDRGTLLDAPSIKSLEEPDRHSVHCLVDVDRCWQSGFEILLPNPSGSPKYGRAYKLDEPGNKLVIEVARKTGAKAKGCTSCMGEGMLKEGFRATVVGEVSESNSGPRLMTVKTLVASPILLNATASDGCKEGTKETNIDLITDSGGDQEASIAHGSLMIISWGFLLPTGIISAHFLKHRPNAIWFKMHRIIQIVGLLIAIIGWAVALATFDVFNIKDNSYTHGALGMTVMILGILQPLNALIRPHAPEKGEDTQLKRRVWEIVHKASGYIAVLLAAVTICFGTIIIFDHNVVFRVVWIISIAWAVFFTLLTAWDQHRYKNANVSSATKSQGEL